MSTEPTESITESYSEFVDSRGLRPRVDREHSVIRGVKILDLRSSTGRPYSNKALCNAPQLYEGAKVNVCHHAGTPSRPRDYQDRIGVLRSVGFVAGEGLFADFHFNPKHTLAEQLTWDAEHAPENVGFSHNVWAVTSRRDGQIVIEAITKVHGVDLVPDPATTRGLFGRDDRSAETPSTRGAWMLSQEWRHGKAEGAIVCDPPPGFEWPIERHCDSIEYYGGLCVLESCSPSVRDHIIDLHNNTLEDQT